MTIERSERNHWFAKAVTKKLPPGYRETKIFPKTSEIVELYVVSSNQITIKALGAIKIAVSNLDYESINQKGVGGIFSTCKSSLLGRRIEIKWKPDIPYIEYPKKSTV